MGSPAPGIDAELLHDWSGNGPDVEKPLNDDRQYKYFELPNKMRVMLVSNPKADYASAALNVGVGSLHEPKNVNGLAHFCEHVIFLGTEKYPKENDYDDFLTKHSGLGNAYTSDMDTCFYFRVAQNVFFPALDRFAQFFISPLFDADGIEREVSAVNSEHEKNTQMDHLRWFNLVRSRCNKDHTMCRFNTGNHETLRDGPKKQGLDIRQELLKFHENYSSNIMTLAVVGRESLQKLEAEVRKLFEPVINKNVNIPRDSSLGNGVNPYTKDTLGCVTYVVPVKDSRVMHFSFPMSELMQHWKTQPTSYIGFCVGHQGKGSLLSALKSRGWVDELTTRHGGDVAGWNTFQIAVNLTPDGLDNVKEVGKIVFAYLRMLQTSPVEKRIWLEHQKIREMNFKFSSAMDSMATAQKLASSMHHPQPPHKIFSGHSLLYEFNPQEIERRLKAFTIDNCMIAISSKTFADKCNQTEKWYGTKYTSEPLPADWKKSWSQEGKDALVVAKNFNLALPEPNPFLPEDFTIKPPPAGDTDNDPVEISFHYYLLQFLLIFAGYLMHALVWMCSSFSILNKPEKHLIGATKYLEHAASWVGEGDPKHLRLPEKIVTPRHHLYVKQDSRFKLPKAMAAMNIYSPWMTAVVTERLARITKFQLWADCLIEDMAEERSVTSMAGLKYSISVNDGGLSISINGYNDKMPTVAKMIGEKLKAAEISMRSLKLKMSTTERNLQNAATTKDAYKQCLEMENRLTYTTNYWLPHERLAAFRELKALGEEKILTEIVKAAKATLSDCYLESLIMGNISKKEALEMANTLADELEMKRTFDNTPEWGAYFLDNKMPAMNIVRNHINLDDKNNCLSVYIYMDENTPTISAYGSVVSAVLGQQFFDSLRTKQQFGYIANGALNQMNGRLVGMEFMLQTTKPLEEARVAVDKFIDEYIEKLQDMKTLRMYMPMFKMAVSSRLRTKDCKLEQEFTLCKREFDRRRFDFGIKHKIREAVDSITPQSMAVFVRDHFVKSPRIYTEVVASGQSASKAAQAAPFVLENMDAWRATRPVSVWDTKIDDDSKI